MAYRINPEGGIVAVKTNPSSEYSSFDHPDYLGFLLKVHREIRIINLNDGSKMVVRERSLFRDTDEKYNDKATKLLHQKSYQKSAVIHGPVIVVLKEDWNVK
jgi:hypothetical protein